MTNQSLRRAVAERVARYFVGFYSSPDEVEPAKLALVFGRNDPKLVDVAAALYDNDSVDYFVVTGGVGKDSGDLPRLGLTEAGFLGDLMRRRGIPRDVIYEEHEATNGGGNCRYSIALIRREHLVSDGEQVTMILVAHWASLYRLYEQMETEGEKLGFSATYQLVPTARPEELNDTLVDELIAEFRRLIDWPGQTLSDGSLSLRPVELPADLVTEVNKVQPPKATT